MRHKTIKALIEAGNTKGTIPTFARRFDRNPERLLAHGNSPLAGLAPQNIVIFFVARSGSSWLTELLTKTRMLGNPEEWFNPDFVAENARNLGAKSELEYIKALQSELGSNNGIFAIECSYSQMELLEEIDFFDIFNNENNTKFFYLRRKDLVAQAISLYSAKNTGIFHASQSRQVEDTKVGYDGPNILHWLVHLLSEEIMFELRFIKTGITPIRLFYEDIVCRAQDTLDLFARVILNRKTLDLPIQIEAAALRRSSTAPIRERFEAEFAMQILQLNRMRPDFVPRNPNGTPAADEQVNSLDLALLNAPYFHVVNALGGGIFVHTNLDINLAKLKLGLAECDKTSVPLTGAKVGQGLYALKFPDFLLERGDGKIEVIIDFGQNEYRVVVPRLNKLTAYIDSVSETTVSGWLSRFGPKSGQPPRGFLLINGGAPVPVSPSVQTPWSASLSNNGGIDGFSIELETNDIVKHVTLVDEAGELICDWNRKA